MSFRDAIHSSLGGALLVASFAFLLSARRRLEILYVKESRTVETNIDERRLHAWQDAGDSAEVDVADRGAMVAPFDVELAEHTVRNETNARFSNVDVDQECVFRHSCFRIERSINGRGRPSDLAGGAILHKSGRPVAASNAVRAGPPWGISRRA